MSVTRCLAISLPCFVFAGWATSAAELSHYRDFNLGSSVAAVTVVTQTAQRDMKTIHSRPALLQEVMWQPRYMSGAPVADRESIDQIVFSFVDDQLFKMTVTYDRTKTTGLTNADMIAALTELYGIPAPPSTQTRPSPDVLDGVTLLAEWQQADAHLALRRSRFSESFSLVIRSLSLDAVASKALATARVIDASEAPAREAALAQKRVDERRQAEELARTANKKVFKP